MHFPLLALGPGDSIGHPLANASCQISNAVTLIIPRAARIANNIKVCDEVTINDLEILLFKH
jgi:hypothetical protein